MPPIDYVYQSTTVPGHEAELVVDGNVDTCGITQSEEYNLSSFSVNFEEDVVVTEVVIDNRGDCCGRYLQE